MRKTTRRLLSLLLAVTMIMSLFSGVTFGSSISAQAAENPLPPEETILGERHEDSQLNYGAFVSGDYSYEILSGGTCKITGYSGTETNLTIPSAINGYSVTAIGESAFYCCSNLTNIVIPSSVVSVDDFAFANCDNLTEIIIPSSVTYIGRGILGGCDKLEYHIYENAKYVGDGANPYIYLISVIDSSVESMIVHEQTRIIGSAAFDGCDNLSDISIPKEVTSIGEWAFANCRKLTDLDLPEKLTNIGEYAIYNCDGLTSIIIPETVTSIGDYAFNSCESLIEITIPAGVIRIGTGVFGQCHKLENIAVHPNNPSYTTDGTVLFSKDWKTLVAAPIVSGHYTVPEGTTSIESSAFANCVGLTGITIPASVNTIGDSAFSCTNLTNIVIPSSVMSVGDSAFSYCDSLTSITILDGVTSIGDYTFSNCSSLTEITIPSSVTFIGEGAFDNCNNLEYNVYDNAKYLGDGANPYIHLISVIDSSVENMTIHEQTRIIGSFAFDGCANLSDISIPKGVTSIGDWAFHNCSGLTNVTIPDSVTSIGDYALYFCESLKSISIPQGVTGIGRATFAHCVNLTDVTIPNSVTSIGDHAFGDCSNLTEITLPDGVTSIGEDAFGQCEKLATVHIPASVTTIGAGAFRMCNNLHSITIPEGVTTIEDSTFDSCKSLTEITIPAGVTSIGYSAFCYCLGLTEITIPANVRSLGGFAFAMCRYLTSITFLGNAPEIGVDCFSDVTADAYIPCDNETWAGVQSIAYSVICKREHLFTDYQIVQDPTCTVEGIRNGVCSSCGETDTETVPALGHVYEDGACARCGQTETNDFSYECLSDGTCIITGYSGNDSVVIIPSKIDGCLVTAIGDYAFCDCSSLIKITFPDSIISVGDYAFYGCSSISEVTLPDSVTSIGSFAFADCGGLSEIIIPGGVTAIGEKSFARCRSLRNIAIPDGITTMENGVFEGCYNLISVNLPDGLISVGEFAFANCYNLRIAVLPDSVITVADYAFENCSNLASIVLPDNMTTIGKYAFTGCNNNVQSIIIPKNVTSIGAGAFAECHNLVSFTVHSDNPAYVAEGAVLFSKDRQTLVSAPAVSGEYTVPNGVVSIEEAAFLGNYDLTGITLPSSITFIGKSAFASCDLSSITISEGLIAIEASAFSGCSGLTEITIPDGVTSIGETAFQYCSNLTKITIPDSVVFIGREAFECCNSLEYNVYDNAKYLGNEAHPYIHLISAIDSSVESVSVHEQTKQIHNSAFAECYGLTKITIPDGVTSIGDNAFYYCTNLTQITIPEGVTSIGNHTFSYCESLTEIILPDSLTSIGDYVFGGCYDLTEMVIPEGVLSIGDWTFFDCHSLTSIDLPKGLTSIGDYAFYHCINLTGIDVPEGVTSIGASAFEQCWEFSKLTLPNSLTSIGASAFRASCLTEVSIPAGVTSIGAGAFALCDKLVNLTVHSDNPVYTAVDNVLFSKDMEVLIVTPSMSGIYTVPEGVTTIADDAFYNCYMLEGVVVPSSVISIGYNTFADCYMDAVTFLGDAPQFVENSFQYNTTTAYYPAGNPTWTEDKLQNYGGEITWVPYTNSQVQVIFKDWDGTVLDSQFVPYGQMPVAPAAPVRDSNSEQYYYYFTGWDKEVTGATEDVTYTAVYELITIPTLTLKAPTLEFKDMITVNAMFTAENIEDVSYMGMLTYDQPVDMVDIWTADHVTYGTEYDETTGRYIAHSQGINAKYLCDTVYLACYARLKDGTYIYSKLASYSPVQYATNQLKNSTDVKLKQLCAAMLNYGAEAQLFFGHNVDNLANASLTDEQKALPEAYRADMVATVPAVDTAKQGIFANNQGFSKRYPAISFEGAFCINYFFTPAYLPEDGITLYYWTEEDYNAADVLTAENASGAWISYRDGIEQYRFDIGGIAARKLADAVYVAAVYSDGTTTWTSGVLGYSIGAYCSSQAAKGGDIADLAMATAVYGYHAKQYFA